MKNKSNTIEKRLAKVAKDLEKIALGKDFDINLIKEILDKQSKNLGKISENIEFLQEFADKGFKKDLETIFNSLEKNYELMRDALFSLSKGMY